MCVHVGLIDHVIQSHFKKPLRIIEYQSKWVKDDTCTEHNTLDRLEISLVYYLLYFQQVGLQCDWL